MNNIGHFEIVQTLINNDANVTLNDSDGRTARDYAQTQDVVLAIDIANENIKNSSRLEKPDDYTDPAWVNVQLQKIKQEADKLKTFRLLAKPTEPDQQSEAS